MSPFPQAIKKYFTFLLDRGFSIVEKEEINTGTFGNGYFVFTSKNTGIEIVLDRGQVLMKIGKSSQVRYDWLEWANVLTAYAPNSKAYDFDIDIESQVRRISELLIQYCTKLLDGNFNDEKLIKVIENKYGKQYLRRFLQA